MKIGNAKAVASIIRFLYRLKVISPEYCDKCIDHLTVLVLLEDLRNERSVSESNSL
jgi:hypothetical protein